MLELGSWSAWRGADAQSAAVALRPRWASAVTSRPPGGPPGRVVRAVQRARYRLRHRPGSRRAGWRGAEVGGL